MASGASVPLVAFVQFGPRHQPPARCLTISDATHVPKIAPQRGFAALPRAGERDDGEALRRLSDVRSQVALDDHVTEHGTRVRLIQNWILDCTSVFNSRRSRFKPRQWKFRLRKDAPASGRTDRAMSLSVKSSTCPAITCTTSPSRSTVPLMASSRPCSNSAR